MATKRQHQADIQSLFGQPVVIVDGQPAVQIPPDQPLDPPSITIQEMQDAFDAPALLQLYLEESGGGIQKPVIDNQVAAIMVADVLDYPVSYIRPQAQVGRFVQVYYKPVSHLDPDLILSLAPNAGAFHQAMAHFQEARVSEDEFDPRQWYRRVRKSARRLIQPLYELQATHAEAAFVLLWGLEVAARARTNPQSLRSGQSRQNRQQPRRQRSRSSQPQHSPTWQERMQDPDYVELIYWDAAANL